MTDWPEELGPTPEAVREWEEHRALAGCETETGLRILVAKADAAIEALIKLNATSQALTKQAEVERLNRALNAGREEYELAVAEMNRRGEEVARLEENISKLQCCATCDHFGSFGSAMYCSVECPEHIHAYDHERPYGSPCQYDPSQWDNTDLAACYEEEHHAGDEEWGRHD